MLTTPITTPLFHSRVLALLATQFSELKDGHLEDPAPIVSSLSATDTAITPNDTISQLVGIASPWVDLSSPDPIVYNISRQVLELEISYAAFCGLGNVVLPGPKLQYGSSHGEGVVQYAYAIQELLALNNYTQILIHLPMMYHPDQDGDDVEGSLSPFTRQEYVEEGGRSKHDFLGTWDAWHVIRTLCKYNARLFVGKNMFIDSISSSAIFVSFDISAAPATKPRVMKGDDAGSLEVLPSFLTSKAMDLSADIHGLQHSRSLDISQPSTPRPDGIPSP